MKRIKTAISVLITLILLIILTYNIYNFININVLKNDITTVAGYTVAEVISGSMEPAIHVGDLIVIDTNDNDYNVGDIVMFYDKNDVLVTHRITSISDNKITTKGDSNNAEDAAVDISRVVGKFVTRIVGGGIFLQVLKNPLTMVMILVIGILTCILISMDKDGNIILEEDEKEFLEYLDNKEKIEDKDSKEIQNISKTIEKKKGTIKSSDSKLNKKTEKEKVESKAPNKIVGAKTTKKSINTNTSKKIEGVKKTTETKGKKRESSKTKKK